MITRLLIIIVSFFISFNTYSNTPIREVTFEKLTSKDGLSQHDVLNIFKDSRGYMWFSTLDGLNKYDGYSYKILRSNAIAGKGITSNMVRKVVEDHDGNIWVASINKDISINNTVTQEIVPICNTNETPNLITNNRINDVICDSKNRIIITTPKGISIIQRDKKGIINTQKIAAKPLAGKEIFSPYFGKLIETSRGEYLFTSEHGIYRLETDIIM